MHLVLYVAGGTAASVLFFRWMARKFMSLCDETWEMSILALRIEMALYISFICAVFAWYNYPNVNNILIAVFLWFGGLYAIIFRAEV